MSSMNSLHSFSEMHFIISLDWTDETEAYGTIKYISTNNIYENEFCCFSFANLIELLFLIDLICDIEKHPSRDTIFRSILVNKGKKHLQVNHLTPKKHIQNIKSMVAFEIVVCRRQRASMQGFLNVFGKQISYRSAMELLKLINEIKICRINKNE